MAGLKNNYQFEFTDTLTTSGTSVRISNEKENGAVAVFTNQYITVRSEDNSIVERMKGSAAAGVLTLTMRGLDQSDTDTQDAGLKREWREGSKAFVTYVASQHVDPRDDNTFSGTQTFNDVVIGDDLTVGGDTTTLNLSVSGKSKPVPKVANITARNALYPSPVDSNMVDVEGVGLQIYRTSAGGWVTFGEETPTPDATEAVKGKAKIATEAESIDDTNDVTIMTPKKTKYVLDTINTVLYETSTEILGESVIPGDSIYLDTGITFAGAGNSQRIGEIISTNARVSGAILGSGTAGSTLKLSLSKTGTPIQNLNIRIETDNAGTPSGTLVDPNATGTVTQASLTTSLADTTIILTGSITLTKGVRYHVVLFQGTYGTETISASNYYNVGYSTNHTSLRGSKLYDGVPSVTDNNTIVYDTSFTTTFQSGVRITANYNCNITSVTKTSLSTATRVQIFTDAGALLATGTFSGDVATLLTPLAITSGVTYRVLADNNGASFNWRTKTSAGFPFAGTGVNTIGGYYSGNSTTAYNIAAVSTAGTGYGSYNPAIQFYTSSTIIENTLLMKTDADYTYKLPTNFARISRQTKPMGSTVVYDFAGVSKQCIGANQDNAFISNTPGLLSTTAGTNSYKVGKFTKINELYINPVTL